MPRKAQNNVQSSSDAAIKGCIAELIVAGMHDLPNVNVERNAKLSSLYSEIKRKREIDVLLTALVAGYPIKIAVECKNYKKVVGAPLIDAFVGKLQDIGIPVQHGIYVSAKGFTDGAREGAKKVGMRLLILTGLTEDRLAANIFAAIQSIVYLVLEITNVEIVNEVNKLDTFAQLLFLYNTNSGDIYTSVPDCLWEKWINNRLPHKIGDHEIEVNIAPDLQNLVDGRFEPVTSLKIFFKIFALVLNRAGKATHHELINVLEKELDKAQTRVEFDNVPRRYELKQYDTEDELQKFLDSRSEQIQMTVERIKVPRIKFNHIYWPISERVAMLLHQRHLQYGSTNPATVRNC